MKSALNIIAMVFVSVVLVAFLVFFLIFLSQRTVDEGEADFRRPSELIDTVKQVSSPEQVDSPIGIRREGFSPSDKPFAAGNYDYDKRTKDFRMVCTRPCPVDEKTLDQEFTAISYAVSTLRGLTKSDFDSLILPFEVHASEDKICPINPGALAYATTFEDDNGYRRGLSCFFFEQLSYNRDRFPYSTSIHEVTHLMEFNNIESNSPLYEGLSEMMESFFLKGNERTSFCWQGNNWYEEEQYSNPHDPHTELAENYSLPYATNMDLIMMTFLHYLERLIQKIGQ